MNIEYKYRKIFLVLVTILLILFSFNLQGNASAKELFRNEDVEVFIERYYSEVDHEIVLYFNYVSLNSEIVSNIEIKREKEVLYRNDLSIYTDTIYNNEEVTYTVTYDKIVSSNIPNAEDNEIQEIVSVEPSYFNFTVIINEFKQQLSEQSSEINNDQIIIDDHINLEIINTNQNEVSNWEELIIALNNEQLNEVILVADITRTGVALNDLPTINHSVTINGNGHYIDFKDDQDKSFVLGNQINLSTFALVNLKIANQGSEYLIRHENNDNGTVGNNSSANNWHIILEDFKSHNNQSQKNVLKATESELTLSNTVEWQSKSMTYNDTSASSAGVFVAQQFTITENSNVNISAIKDIFNSNPENINSKLVKMEVKDGADVTLKSEDRTTIWLGKEGVVNPIQVNIYGENTRLYSTSSNYGSGNGHAVMSFSGNYLNNNQIESFVKITNGAKVKAISTNNSLNVGYSSSAILSQIRGGKFIVDGENTSLYAESLGSDDALGATFRLRLVGNQSLDISNNAEVEIKRVGTLSKVPAIRFYGSNNTLNVSLGGKLKVYNAGSQSPLTPGGEGRNQGIQYQTVDSSVQLIKVTDKGSLIEIISDYGAVIDIGGLGTGEIEVSDDAVFIAKGNTLNQNEAIFNSHRLIFNISSPHLYDFANIRNGGGRIFNVNAGSTYAAINSDFAIWEFGDSTNRDPRRFFSKLDFKLRGTNLSTIDSTNFSEEFNSDEDSFGTRGMENKTRIYGSNNRPIIDEIIQSENANRYLYGHISVAEGYYDLRDAWNDEVYVELKVTYPDLSSKTEIIKTVGKSNNDLGIPIYGQPARGGVFVYDNKTLIPTNTKFEVLSVWRGLADKNSDRNYFANSDELIVTQANTIDTTPPKPAKILNERVVQTTRYFYGEYYPGSSFNNDQVADGKLFINQNIAPSTFTINPDYTWNAKLDSSIILEDEDIIQVVLIDENGNENPLSDTVYHDTVFEGASSIKVDAIKYAISAKNRIIGLDSAKAIKSENDILNLVEAKSLELIENQVIDSEIIESNFKPTPGVYVVKIGVSDDLATSVDVTIEVLDYDYVSEGNEYLLVANHVYLSHRDVEGISDEKLISQANAHAINIIDRSLIKSVNILAHNLKINQGKYDITYNFTEERNLELISSTYVFEYDIVKLYDEHIFVSNNIILDKSEVSSLTDEKLLEKTAAKVLLKSDFTSKSIEVLSHTIDAKAGKYQIEFIELESKLKNLMTNSEVFDYVDYTKEIAFNGTVGFVKMKELSNSSIIKQTRTKAYDVSDILAIKELKDLMLTSIPSNKTDENGYQVEIIAKNESHMSTFKTIIYIFDDYFINDQTNQGFALNAEDFKDVIHNTFSIDQVLKFAKVNVFEIDDANVTLNPSLKKEVNVSPFPLLIDENTFTYTFEKENQKIEVEKSAVISNSYIKLKMKDAVIDLKTSQSLTQKDLLELVVSSLSHADSNVDINDLEIEITNDSLVYLTNLTSSSMDGISVSVKVSYGLDNVESQSIVYVANSLDDNVAWTANNFALEAKDQSNSEKIKQLANVKAYLINDVMDINYPGPELISNDKILVDKYPTSNLPYGDDVIFKIKKIDSKSSVLAFVFDEINSDNLSNKVGWTGFNYVTELKDLENGDDYFIEKNKITAHRLVYENGELINVVKIDEIVVKNKPTNKVEAHKVNYSVIGSYFNCLFYVVDTIDTSHDRFQVAWLGNDTYLKLSDVDVESIKERTKIKALDITDVNLVKEIDSSLIQVSNIPSKKTDIGASVNFEVVQKNQSSKHHQLVYVFDDVALDENNNGIALSANDFESVLGNVVNVNDIKNYAEVNVYEISNNKLIYQADFIADVIVNPLPLKIGVNEVTYIYENQNKTLMTDKVATIKDTDIYLAVQDGYLSLKDAQDLNESELKQLVIKSLSHQDESVLSEALVVSLDEESLVELNNLKHATINGIKVEINVKYGNDLVTKVARVYVFDEVIDRDEVSKVGFIGHDFVMSVDDIDQNDLSYITIGQVSAFMIDEHSNSKISKIDSNDIQVIDKPKGITNSRGHTVSYKAGDVILRLKAFVFEELKHVNEGTNDEYFVGWNGNEIIIEVSKISDKELVKQISDIKAYIFKNDYLLYEVRPDDIGVKDVVQITDDGVRNDAKESIKDNFVKNFQVVNSTTNEAINFKNFKIGLNNLNINSIINNSEITVYDISDISAVEEVDASNILLNSILPTSRGIYELEFITIKGTLFSITADIYDVEETRNNISLFANDFTINENMLDSQMIRNHASLTGYYLLDDNKVSIDESNVTVQYTKSGLGESQVYFLIDNKVYLQVNMQIVTDVMIEATDFSITLSEYMNLKLRGELEGHVIDVSNAKLLINNVEDFAYIKVKDNQLVTIDPLITGQYKITLAYSLPKFLSRNGSSDEEVNKSIVMTIVDDRPRDENQSPEYHQVNDMNDPKEALWIIMPLILLIVIIIARKYTAKNKKS